MRKTKIICTVGPATDKPGILEKMMHAGMNVARFNFSHATYDEHARRFHLVTAAREAVGLPIATMLDTRGPEIRLGNFVNDKPVDLATGGEYTLTTREIPCTDTIASISFKGLPADVSIGTDILINDGLVALRVKKIDATDILCDVIEGGRISNHKGVNVPGAKLTMPFIDKKDRNDIIYACEMGFDFIAASFVRCKEDVLEIREILKQYNSKIQIISKIESVQGIENLAEILEVSDGIMVARGDMGVEVPMEEVPIIQKKIIKMAVHAGKHVITATQMLDSMMKHPRPTRAEATDVANAIYDGTTGIMLSGETANGDYPLEALQTMARIAERTEQDIDYTSRMRKAEATLYQPDTTSAICHATCNIAADLNVQAIITVTMSGFTSAMIARYKPSCPIIGCTTSRLVWRQMNLQWGVSPLLISEENTAEDLFREAVNAALEAGYVKKGDRVVLTAGIPLGISGKTNMLRVVEV